VFRYGWSRATGSAAPLGSPRTPAQPPAHCRQGLAPAAPRAAHTREPRDPQPSKEAAAAPAVLRTPPLRDSAACATPPSSAPPCAAPSPTTACTPMDAPRRPRTPATALSRTAPPHDAPCTSLTPACASTPPTAGGANNGYIHAMAQPCRARARTTTSVGSHSPWAGSCWVLAGWPTSMFTSASRRRIARAAAAFRSAPPESCSSACRRVPKPPYNPPIQPTSSKQRAAYSYCCCRTTICVQGRHYSAMLRAACRKHHGMISRPASSNSVWIHTQTRPHGRTGGLLA
jgi:hypothetical protein